MNIAIRTAQRKSRNAPRVYVWAPIIWAAIIIGLPIIAATLDAALGGPKGEPIVAAIAAFLLALAFGWVPALFIWLIAWGTHGWVGLGSIALAHNRRRAHLRAASKAAEDKGAEPAAISSDEMWAQWRDTEMNPYGCCFSNADVNGFPAHGGPHCQHPAILEKRASQDA